MYISPRSQCPFSGCLLVYVEDICSCRSPPPAPWFSHYWSGRGSVGASQQSPRSVFCTNCSPHQWWGQQLLSYQKTFLESIRQSCRSLWCLWWIEMKIWFGTNEVHLCQIISDQRKPEWRVSLQMLDFRPVRSKSSSGVTMSNHNMSFCLFKLLSQDLGKQTVKKTEIRIFTFPQKNSLVRSSCQGCHQWWFRPHMVNLCVRACVCACTCVLAWPDSVTAVRGWRLIT